MKSKILTIILFSGLPFLFSLDGDFVFDDLEAIVQNKDVTVNPWYSVFRNDFWGSDITNNLSHKSYRPLTTLSFRLNFKLHGNRLSALHFKATNLVLHIICSILLFITFKNIVCRFKSWERWEDTIYFATLLFSVHPVHVENVCGIVGRADILAAIAFFLSLLCYNKSMNNSKFTYYFLFLTNVLAGVSMLFKENGVTVLAVCIVYELLANIEMKKVKPKNYKSKNSKSQKSHSIYLNPYSKKRIVLIFLGIILLLSIRWIIMGGSKPEFKATDNPAAYSDSLFTKIATYNYIYFLNIMLLVWPEWLCYDWSMGCVPLIEEQNDFRIYFVVILYLWGFLIMYYLLKQRKKISSKRPVIFAILMGIIPFLPAANIFFPVGFVVAERVLYISSAGYCLFFSIGLRKLFRKYNKKVIRLFYSLLLILALRSWQRSFDWQNDYKLFTSGLAVCPSNAKAHYNMAKVLSAREENEEAIVEYREAIRLYPDYHHAMNNLANLLKVKEEYEEAEYYLRKAIYLKRDFPAAWMNLGIVLSATHQYKESEDAYKTALEYRNYNYDQCLFNLGNLYLDMHKIEAAIEHWFRTVQLNPTHAPAWTNLLASMDNTGQLQRASFLIPRALAKLPGSPTINFSVANIYGKMNMFKEAEIYFKNAITLFGNRVQPTHYTNFGVLYHRWSKYGLAEKMYLKALELDPNFKSAKKNLARLQQLKNGEGEKP